MSGFGTFFLAHKSFCESSNWSESNFIAICKHDAGCYCLVSESRFYPILLKNVIDS